MKLLKKEKVRKIDNKFISYSGYVPELNMFCMDGLYFKMYEPLFDSYDTGSIRDIMSSINEGFRMQIIHHEGKIRILFGKEAESFDEATQLFPETNEVLRECSHEEWFCFMAERLIFDNSIPELPLNKRGKPKRKATMLGQIMPYNVKSSQKTMDISGQMTKTVILTRYPGELFPAFTTELLSLSPKITVSLHVEPMDAELCLQGISLASGQRVARKETMKYYLENMIKKDEKLYNVCYLISLSGLPGDIEDLYQKLLKFCDRYLIGLSELDFQQMNAFKSTLPLMKNRIAYNRVISKANLEALLPWSELKDTKQAVLYGEDTVCGAIHYNRLVHSESGCILSSDYIWSIGQVKKEISGHILFNPSVKEEINIIVRNDFDVKKHFGDNANREKSIKISLSDVLSPELYKSAVILWALRIRSVNDHITRPDYLDIMKAADIPSGGDFLEQFMSRLDEKHLRSLHVRPFKEEVSVEVWDSKFGTVYRVDEEGVFEELCYMGLLHKNKGLVYSLHSELLSDNRVTMFMPSSDCIYTLLSEDNKSFYNSKLFSDFIKKAPFLLIGGHVISEKLMVSTACGLTKEERAAISEPATKKLFFTSLANYELKDE